MSLQLSSITIWLNPENQPYCDRSWHLAPQTYFGLVDPFLSKEHFVCQSSKGGKSRRVLNSHSYDRVLVSNALKFVKWVDLIVHPFDILIVEMSSGAGWLFPGARWRLWVTLEGNSYVKLLLEIKITIESYIVIKNLYGSPMNNKRNWRVHTCVYQLRSPIQHIWVVHST